MNSKFYPYLDEIDFGQLLDKYEFKDDLKREYIYQEPRQLFLSKYLSKNTIYDNLLVYWKTGTGKTAVAITIAESFKEYVSNMGKKILILTKNENIEKNFRNELITEISKNEYLSDTERENLLYGDSNKYKQLKSNVNRRINKIYDFRTYRTFVNQVIGMKEFQKDTYGLSMKKKQRDTKGQEVRKTVTSSKGLTNLNNTLIIIDEAHNIKSGDFYNALKSILEKSVNYRLVLLTATPMFDTSKDIVSIANILNINNPSKLIKSDKIMKKTQPESELLKTEIYSFTKKGKEMINNAFLGKVSYLDVNTQMYPEKVYMGEPVLDKEGSVKVIKCEMSLHQYKYYKKIIRSDSDVKYNKNIDKTIDVISNKEILEETTHVSKSDSLYKNSSDASTFVFSNGLFGKEGFDVAFNKNGTLKEEFKDSFKGITLKKNSAKLYNLLNNVKIGTSMNGTIFIYSNYVNNGGTELIKHLLLNNGYKLYSKGKKIESGHSFILFDDSIKSEIRDEQKKIFNSSANKNGDIIKIIVGSPIISEGITLKNVRQIHILEPSWNMSKKYQIEGRGIRHKSHELLAPEDRRVDIYAYCSIHSKDPKGIFIDKEKYILSEQKDRSIKSVERLLKKIAIDCSYNSPNPNYIHYTSDCDYDKCEYTCNIKKSGNIDKSTYNYFIDDFDEFDISFNTTIIKELFQEYFIWNIQDIISTIKKKSNNIISNESIYKTLIDLVETKELLTDKYDREGFIIQKGSFFIFNPLDIDIETSLYSKMMDFEQDINQYNLSEYLKLKDIILDKSESKKKNIKEKKLTEAQIKENENIIKNNKIYGSYRTKKLKNQLFSDNVDDKLKIIDVRKTIKVSDDYRKNVTGMNITSFKIPQLMDITNFLKIKIKDSSNMNKQDYIDLIKTHMIKNNMILH